MLETNPMHFKQAAVCTLSLRIGMCLQQEIKQCGYFLRSLISC